MITNPMSPWRDHKPKPIRTPLRLKGVERMVDLYGVDLNADEARKFLSSAKYREHKDKQYSSWSVLYNKKWLKLGETTLTDDVPTFTVWSSHPIDKQHYLDNCLYGARIKDSGFFIVSALSDG